MAKPNYEKQIHKLGWDLYRSDPPRVEHHPYEEKAWPGSDPSIPKQIPGNYAAQKRFGDLLRDEHAESVEQLYDRVAAYENGSV